MRTTLISRGEEWIPSTPIHLDMFRALGWKAPKYAHLPSIMKLDHGNKRKLSKRKDPEAAVSFFLDAGYPVEALKAYLMSIANSSFEEWTAANKTYDISKFPFSIKKMSLEGALFDIDKLNFFSKEIIAKMPIDIELEKVRAWAKEHAPEVYARIEAVPEYFKKILNIEKDRKTPRKDYAKFSDIYPLVKFFFEDEYEKILAAGLTFKDGIDHALIKDLLKALKEGLPFGAEENDWFNRVKEIGVSYGFAGNNKDYKANPEAYKGSVSDVAEILRVALVGSPISPNLHEVIEILGKDTFQKRLDQVIASL